MPFVDPLDRNGLAVPRRVAFALAIAFAIIAVVLGLLQGQTVTWWVVAAVVIAGAAALADPIADRLRRK